MSLSSILIAYNELNTIGYPFVQEIPLFINNKSTFVHIIKL